MRVGLTYSRWWSDAAQLDAIPYLKRDVVGLQAARAKADGPRRSTRHISHLNGVNAHHANKCDFRERCALIVAGYLFFRDGRGNDGG